MTANEIVNLLSSDDYSGKRAYSVCPTGQLIHERVVLGRKVVNKEGI